jgi:short-subunit dehydrogenase
MTNSVHATSRPVALITGASAGLGKIFAQRYAAIGHDLILVARDSARLQAVADELALQFGVDVDIMPADLSRDVDMRRVAERIAQTPELAALVNNAGFGTKGKLVNRPIAEQMTMLELHVMAPMLLTRAALPAMIERGVGSIINVASVASFAYSTGNVNYCATKAYLRVFCEGLGMELAGTGVKVQALCPGFTHTEFHDRAAIDKTTLPSWLWLDAGRVVDDSLAQIARGGPVVCVPALRYKLIVFLIKYLPEWLKSGARGRYGKSRV